MSFSDRLMRRLQADSSTCDVEITKNPKSMRRYGWEKIASREEVTVAMGQIASNREQGYAAIRAAYR